MGGLNSGPGPGITLLIAIVLVLAQTASSAPLYEEDEGQESNSQSLAESHGCYYNFQHYNEGERILTNEPCLNCTCRNRMLMCYLRVCPFTKGIGQNCTVEKVPGQCCPIITCPEVPVQLLTSTTTEGIKAPGGQHGSKGTAVGHLDTNGCNIDGIFYPNGAQVPGSPEKPCELCYCIRNKTACIMQECALHVDGCRPVYEEGQCFPVRYQCDDSPYEEQSTTTIRPAPTPGLIITTTSAEPLDCTYNSEIYNDGSRIQTEDPCEHCYCLKGKIACAVQECGAPLEKEGQNCTALPPAPGKCCPDSYQCDVTMTSQGINYDNEGTTEAGIPSVEDAGHPTDGYHPDQGVKTTEKTSQATNTVDLVTEKVTPSKDVEESKPTKTKPEELDKETEKESIEGHLQGLHPMKPISTSDDNQKITFPVNKNEGTKRPGITDTSEVGQPETTHIKENESYDHTTVDHIIDTSNKKERPHPESEPHVSGASTKRPETAKPADHSEGTVFEHPDLFGIQPSHSQGQTSYNPTTNNVLNTKPQTSASDTKDPLIDKLHNIIQDVQAQVNDGKTTEMAEQVEYQTTMQSQTGHFTDRPEILSHLPQLGSQTSSTGFVEMGSTANGTSPDDSNDIINKLQGIIQGIYSHVTDSIKSTRTPESSTIAGETQSNIPFDSSGIIRPEDASESENIKPEKEDLKPHKENEYPVKPTEVHTPHGTEATLEPEVKGKHPSEQTTEKVESEKYGTDHPITIGIIDGIKSTQHPYASGRPQDSKYSTETVFESHSSTEHPKETTITSLSGDSTSKHPEKPAGSKLESSIKVPLRPKPEVSYDETYGAKHPEVTNDVEKEVLSTERPYVTGRPDLSKYPQETNNYKPGGSSDYSGESTATKRPFDKEDYPVGHKPDQELPGLISSSHNQSHYPGFPSLEKHPELYPDGNRPTQYPEEFKPSSQYPEAVETTEQNVKEIGSSEQYLEKFKPGQQDLEGISPTPQYSDQIKPLGQYHNKTRPTGFADAPETEYPESVTAEPDGETKYPASILPSEQYPEEHTLGHLDEVKPTGIYSGENERTEEYPEGIKPSQVLTGTKPEQQFEGNEPTEYYPEKAKPDSPSNTSFQISYPEDKTGKPSDVNKYPPSSKYSNQTGSVEPESSSSETPFDIKPTESSIITSETGNASAYPEGRPVDEYLVPEIPTGSKPYSTEVPEESGVTDLPDSFTRVPEILKPGTTDEPEYSTTYSQKNRPEQSPYGNQHHEDTGFTKIFETTTKHSESGKLKPDDQSKYPEGYRPGQKPLGSYPEGSNYPEIIGITDRPEDQTYIHTTQYSEDFKPNENLESSEGSLDKNKPYGSTDSDVPTENPSETGVYSKPKPESDMKPLGVQYPEITYKPETSSDTKVTDSLLTFSKYPEKTKPEETFYGTEQSEDVTGKPDEGSKYSENIKPIEEYPDYSKHPITGRPESSKRPFSSEHPEASGVTHKPEEESKHPEKVRPTDENLQKPKPGSENEFYGSEYLETTDKPEFSYESSTYKYSDKSSSTQKADFAGYPDDSKSTQQSFEDSVTSRPQEQSKYSQKPEMENKPYSTESPESTDKLNEQFTEHPDHKKPDDDEDHHYPEDVNKKPADENSYPVEHKIKDEENQTGVSGKPDKTYESAEEDTTAGRPQGDNKYSQKPGTETFNVTDHEGHKPAISQGSAVPGKQPQNKPESGNEFYGTEYTERPKVPGAFDSEHKLHGTEYPEGVTVQPVDSSKYPDENKEQGKHPEKPESEHLHEGAAHRPEEENLEQNMTIRPQEPPKYPEEAYVAQHPEKVKPPSEDQLLETDVKPESFGEYPEKTKPVDGTKYPEKTKPVEIEIDKPVDGTKYSEKSKPSSGTDSDKPDITGHPEKPGKPIGSYESPEGITKSPQYTAQYPGKPEYSEEMGISKKPQYPKEPEYSEKIKPMKPESGEVPYGTEYPEKGRPDEVVPTIHTEEIVTDKSQDLNKYPLKSKPGSLDKPSDFEEELFGASATDKPEDKQKYPEGLKHPTKTKPGTEHSEVSETDKPFDIKVPGEEIGKPEHSDEETEKDISSGTEKLGTTYPPKYGSEIPQTPMNETFGMQYPNSEIGAGMPEDSNKYPDGLKPVEHKEPQDTEYPKLPGKPEYESKHPEDLTQMGQYTQRPYGSTASPGSEYPDNKVTGRPEHHTKSPEENEVDHDSGLTDRPQYSTKYPQGEKLHDSEIFHGTESPIGAPEYHSKYPDKFTPMGIHPEAGNKPQQSNKYPGSSTQHPEEVTDRTNDYTKYPESVTGLLGDRTKYPEGLKPTENYSGSLQGFTKYPEGDHSFNTKYPELGLTEASEDLTKHPGNLQPEGFHPGQPQVPEENLALSTEHINTGETDEPDISTKYSEDDKAHVTEYPANFGITHEKSFTEHSLYGTENTYISGTTNKYTQKFKPGHGLTDHSTEKKPTETYSHGSERPEEEESFESGGTVSPDAVTKYSDNMKPVDSETAVHGIKFPEGITDKPENVKRPDETETEYSETNTDEPIKENEYSEEFRPTAEYPQGSIKYSPRPKPGLESKPYGTERPEITDTSKDKIGFTGYPYESSTGRYPQHPELVGTTVFGVLDESSEYPHGFKPGSVNLPENLGVKDKTHGSVNYPHKKPSLEDETSESQYPDKTGQPGSTMKFPDDKKPEGVETFGTEITDKPEKSKYPEESKYSEITTPDFKHPQRPKPVGSNDIPSGTSYPETTDSEGNIGITETPEYLGQHSSTQHPKQTESGEKLHGTENGDNVTVQPEDASLSPGITKSPIKYPVRPKPASDDESYGEEHSGEIDFTEKPDDESKYSDKTGYLTNRPILGRPKPTGSDQSFVTEYPNTVGQTSSSKYPETSKPGFENELYGNVYSETTTKLVLEYELHGTEYPDGSDKLSHGSKQTETPHGTEYPEASKPDASGQLYTSTRYPEKPNVSTKYPVRPKPDASEGNFHVAATEKPEYESFGTQYPKGAENTVSPEEEKYPEYTKITGKPHGIHRYPLRPKPAGLEDEPFGTEYSETTEEFDETSTVQGQEAFGKDPVRLKPVTEHPDELYLNGKPVESDKVSDKIKPESDQSFSTEVPESVFGSTPHVTQYPDGATARPYNENKHSGMFKPTEKYPDESGEPEKPYNTIKYPETHTEGGENLYSTEHSELTGMTKYPEGPEPQKPEDEVSTELFGVTRKPASSSDVSTDEFSAKPGTAYLPQGGGLFNEKVPGSEHLGENVTPVVSEHSSTTEIYFGVTDPAPGSPAEGDLFNTLHNFENHQDKPPSVDLTHEFGSSPSSQDSISEYPQHTTTPSDLHEPDQFSTKPIGGAKPTEPEVIAPIPVDDYPGRPKPIVPGEGSDKKQDPHTGFVESSSFPTKMSESENPEIPSGSEVAGIKKPDDEHHLSEVESTQYPSQYFSTTGPSIHKYSDSTHNLTSTVKPANEDTHSEEISNTESSTEYVTYGNYPESVSLPGEGFTRRPDQDSVSFIQSTTDTSQGLYFSEKVSTGAITVTPSDNDLINKLHDIISGIQSQVTDGKTTKQPYGGYESTSPFGLPTETPQNYYLVTDKFGKPVQKPQESAKLPHDQTPESLSKPSRHPVDGIFSSENATYHQTTTNLEGTESGTDRPQFDYTSVSGSTEHSGFVTSKGPEGILPTEVGDRFSTKYPHQETAEEFPHGLKPVSTVGKPENTEFLELEKPHDVKHPEVPIKDAVTSHPDQSSPISKYPTDELHPKPEGFTSTELPGRPTKPESKYPEETTEQFSHKSSTSDSASFSHYPEDISTTASSVISFEDSGKPHSPEGNQETTPTETGNATITSSYTQDHTTQIYEEVKENQTPIKNVNNLIAENNKTAPEKEDLSHETIPQDVNQKHPILVPTDKPLHVVYPTYYPDGVVTRTPGGKPEGETDKKVTVTPQTTVYKGTTIKSTDSSLTSVSEFGGTHTVYETHTEISGEFSTTSPVVIIQEVHTEVHSERAPIKTDTDSFVQPTPTSTNVSKPEISTGKPHGYGPEHDFEKFTKQPELTSQTPQIIFGRPAIIQPTGDQLSPESQTFQPQAGHSENEKFSTSSIPAKEPESSTKPGYVTVTPVGMLPVTKDFENIMHLYSSKDKHPTSTSSIHHPESFTTVSPAYPERVKLTTEKGETAGVTEIKTNFVTDQSVETTHTPEISGTRFPSRKTTQRPTDGVPAFEEGTTQGIGEQYEMSHGVHPGVTKQPSFDILTEGLPSQNKTTEVSGFTTAKEPITPRPHGASFVPYKVVNGNKIYYPEKESSERPTVESSPFDGYDQIPYEIVNGTKFFYPNRVVTSQPEAPRPTTTFAPMGMYVPYKIVNGSKVYYTQDKPQKPEKFDGLDYVPFDIINGTKIFYPERVTTTPSPSSAMYVPFKIIDGTKVYYPKEAQEEPQNIPDEYDGFDYVPYSIVNGSKIFHPDYIPDHVPTTTERLPAMYVPYKLLNGNKVYYPKDAQNKPESIPEEYDGFDLVPYEVVNGTKLFYPDQATTPASEQITPSKIFAMFVPYKVINGTKVYFPKYAQNKPTRTPEGYDGFDYLPYENVNGTKVFRPEKVTPKPEFTSTPAFYSSGMFVPYKIINNTKVFFPKDAQHKPRPLKPGYDGVQYLPYDVVNGTKIFYPERVTTPKPIVSSSIYVPYKLVNGTKVYYADKATENPEKIPEGYEGFDYVPYEIVNGNKVFFPDRLKPTMGMYVPYKKVNGSKVYYPKDSSEKRQPIPEGYDGTDYIPYEIINGTKVFYPDRVITSQPPPIMYVPYKMVNGTKVYYPKDAQHKPYLVTEGYDGFDSVPYEIINGTNIFHPEDITQRPAPAYPQGMFVPYKVINGTKVYYPQEAHKRPHPLSDEYAGLDYIPYEVVNGTKVFHPERLTPNAVPSMYVPYKLINGTKVFYPKHAQHNPQQIPSEYDGFDYVPYDIVNGSQVFYPNRIPNYQGMYVPYKIINGEKVFYPNYAQHKPSEVLEGYDGFDYLPYESINGTNVIKPAETATETPFEQAMYVPYKVINGTKVFYAEYAQYKPYLIPQGFDGFDYIPYEIVNGTKVFDPDLVATPNTPYKPAMYVPYKIIDGKKVYYPKHAQNKPHLVPEGYDGFDYIPYEVINGTKIFDPEQAVAPGPDFKPSLYVPYKIMNGIKVYQPKYAQHKPSHLPQDYDGFDYLPYDVVNGIKVFYPEQTIPLKQAMYVPFKYVNGTKVFYPKYAQYVPVQISEDYDGFEYIPYEIVKGDKVFHPEQAAATETPFRKAMYVPYKVLNGTKIYYPKNSHYNPYLIPQGYDGFDYIPYEVVNGNKVFHPEQAITPETSFTQAMYVPFRVINGTKVYYPKHAQPKPQLIPENYDGFDYLPYKVVNETKVFDPQVSSRPTYLQGMYVPYKSVNNTKVFYPKDAHNKPNYTPEGYDGADYVPYEPLNNTKMFYPELISTAQPGKHGSAGVYVPFKVVNNKKVFYPKEATPFPPTVRYPYDGVAFVPHKMLGETSPSEIVYVDDNETFKPHQPPLQPGEVPGEGSCFINNKTFANNTEIPPVSPCQASCICASSVVRCVRIKCPPSPENKLDCSPVYREGSCCPTYVCGDSDYEYSTTTGYAETKIPEFAETGSTGQDVDATIPFAGYGTQKRPSSESGNATGEKKPEVQAPSEEYHLHKPPKPKPEHESLEPYDSVEGQLTPDEDYDVEDEEPYGPGTCRYAGKVYVSAQQIPRDDPCDFCFCFRSDIICLQQSCPPPIPGCRDEPIQGFCCPRYECHVKMATMINVTSTTTTTTTTLPPHFFPHAFKGSATKTGCFVQGRAYRVGQAIPSASGPCMDCICGGNGRMKCEPKVCTPEPMIRKMISPSENVTSPSNER